MTVKIADVQRANDICEDSMSDLQSKNMQFASKRRTLQNNSTLKEAPFSAASDSVQSEGYQQKKSKIWRHNSPDTIDNGFDPDWHLGSRMKSKQRYLESKSIMMKQALQQAVTNSSLSQPDQADLS